MLAEVLGLLAVKDSPAPAAPLEIGFVGLPESDAQIVAERVLEDFDGVRLTLLAKPGDVRVVLFDEGAGADALSDAAARIASELGEHRYTTTGESLAAEVLHAARAAGCTLATAESCTGGLVAAALTDVPGSSDVFRGGVVAYANDAKIALLGVSEAALDIHGAVSRECAIEMATGVRAILCADLAVAVTGIAGPSGGTPDKPIGLVWFAVATSNGADAFERAFPGDRSGVRARATTFALDLLRRAALDR